LKRLLDSKYIQKRFHTLYFRIYDIDYYKTNKEMKGSVGNFIKKKFKPNSTKRSANNDECFILGQFGEIGFQLIIKFVPH